jgi:hypothetical protein
VLISGRLLPWGAIFHRQQSSECSRRLSKLSHSRKWWPCLVPAQIGTSNCNDCSFFGKRSKRVKEKRMNKADRGAGLKAQSSHTVKMCFSSSFVKLIRRGKGWLFGFWEGIPVNFPGLTNYQGRQFSDGGCSIWCTNLFSSVFAFKFSFFFLCSWDYYFVDKMCYYKPNRKK